MKRNQQVLLSLIYFIFIIIACTSCSHTDQGIQMNKAMTSPSSHVKSVMLYDSINKWPIDTIQSAIDRLNEVIGEIESRPAGYSIWKVQSDTINTYQYLIQGHWPDQAAFDSIHVNPDFRKQLDADVHVYNETRKWKLYRRYEAIQSSD